ncbi:MAG: DUF357 domain-containing protein, partial [Methanocorpusculum sp.]|nr:DUF357 domain-containing protein [Methanocorpusculum sp.]
MLIEELVSYYQKTAAKASPAVPKASILGGTADEILEMVTCYASDAAVFLKHGDLVNAFAASEYGLGWLDCGVYLGYVNAEISNCLALEKEFPTDLFEKLEEKTIYDFLSQSRLFIGEKGPEALSGTGNYILPVYASDGTDQVNALLYCLDSNDYTPDKEKYGEYG